jgi:hypothetical protein
LLSDGDDSETATGFVISDFLFDGEGENEELAHVPSASIDTEGDFSFAFTPSLFGATYYYRAYAENAVGISYGAPKRFVSEHDEDTVPETEDGEHLEGEDSSADDDPWAGSVVGEGGWLGVDWFGAILPFENGWIYHQDLGWLFAMPDGENGVWLWQAGRGWLWTKQGLWPYLYQVDTSEWIYFLGSSDGKLHFYNYATDQVE